MKNKITPWEICLAAENSYFGSTSQQLNMHLHEHAKPFNNTILGLLFAYYYEKRNKIASESALPL